MTGRGSAGRIFAFQIMLARMPEIIYTPWLIWFLEHTAREAILPYLEQGESTVGVHIEIDHLAAMPVGQHVICHARVVQSEGKKF